MLSDDHIAITRQCVLASRNTYVEDGNTQIARCVVDANIATRTADAPLLPAEQEMERWRIATQLVQKMKMAGFACQLTIPARPH
jgi:hypothetical protein